MFESMPQAHNYTVSALHVKADYHYLENLNIRNDNWGADISIKEYTENQRQYKNKHLQWSGTETINS